MSADGQPHSDYCRGKELLAPDSLGLNTHGPFLVTKVLNLSGVSAVLGVQRLENQRFALKPSVYIGAVEA